MCSVVQNLIDMGQKQGRMEDIKRMLQSGKTPEQIADFCEYALNEVKAVQESMLTN